MSNRYQVTGEEITSAFNNLHRKLEQRINEKGKGIFISSHEVHGIIYEEVNELTDAVRSNENISSELLDIAVAALWGYISSKSNKMDW